MPDVAQRRDFNVIERHQTWTRSGPVVSHLPDAEIAALEERAVATVAEPSTLGLWGFATGTWMAATVLGGFLPASDMLALMPTVLLFAGIAQFIAGLYAYRRVDALGATAFCCFGAFNTTAGVMMTLGAVGAVTPQTGLHEMMGFLLESFAFISIGLALAAVRRNVVLVCVLVFLCAGYALTGIGQLAWGPSGLGPVEVAGGICLFVSAFFAYYLGLALLVNSAWNRTVFPIMGEP